MPIEIFSDIKNHSNFKRGGVIPYIKTESGFLFCLGIDSKSSELTDFGGGITSKDKNFMKGAIREFNEESLYIFDTFGIFPETPVATNRDTVIIFSYIPSDPAAITEKFRDKAKTHKNPEVSDIVWLDFIQFTGIMHGCSYPIGNRKIYEKVQKTLMSEESFVPKLFFSLDKCPVYRPLSEYTNQYRDELCKTYSYVS